VAIVGIFWKLIKSPPAKIRPPSGGLICFEGDGGSAGAR